jgi:hypothetical protein
MNPHDGSSVYCACNSDFRAIGITATTLSDSPCLIFVLLRQTHVPLEHCTYISSARVFQGRLGIRTWSLGSTPSSGLSSLQTLKRSVSVMFVGGDERVRETV